MRPNSPANKPQPLFPLPQFDPDSGAGIQLQLATQRLLDGVIPDAAERPVNGQARSLRDARGHLEGEVIEDVADGVVVVTGSSVEVGDEDSGFAER